MVREKNDEKENASSTCDADKDIHNLGGVQLGRHGARLPGRKQEKEGGSKGRSSSSDKKRKESNLGFRVLMRPD